MQLSRRGPLLPFDAVGSVLLGFDPCHRLIDPLILCTGQRNRLAARAERDQAGGQYQVKWIFSHSETLLTGQGGEAGIANQCLQDRDRDSH